MSFEVTFPGGREVDVSHRGHTVRTDQPVLGGGQDSAMSPFDLFFASMATCMGFYALRFCQERGLKSDGLHLTLTPVRDADGKRVKTVHVELYQPDDFPEKYRTALLRSVDHCAVKRILLDPPAFEIEFAGVTAA